MSNDPLHGPNLIDWSDSLSAGVVTSGFIVKKCSAVNVLKLLGS